MVPKMKNVKHRELQLIINSKVKLIVENPIKIDVLGTLQLIINSKVKLIVENPIKIDVLGT
jgi:hypothetical protein